MANAAEAAYYSRLQEQRSRDARSRTAGSYSQRTKEAAKGAATKAAIQGTSGAISGGIQGATAGAAAGGVGAIPGAIGGAVAGGATAAWAGALEGADKGWNASRLRAIQNRDRQQGILKAAAKETIRQGVDKGLDIAAIAAPEFAPFKPLVKFIIAHKQLVFWTIVTVTVFGFIFLFMMPMALIDYLIQNSWTGWLAKQFGLLWLLFLPNHNHTKNQSSIY